MCKTALALLFCSAFVGHGRRLPSAKQRSENNFPPRHTLADSWSNGMASANLTLNPLSEFAKLLLAYNPSVASHSGVPPRVSKSASTVSRHPATAPKMIRYELDTNHPAYKSHDRSVDVAECPLQPGQKVRVVVTLFTKMGARATILDEQVAGTGLIIKDDLDWYRSCGMTDDIYRGDEFDVFISKVRGKNEDGEWNCDFTLRGFGLSAEVTRKKILEALEASQKGFIPLGDRSAAQAFGELLPGITKTEFKKEVGKMYKEGLVIPGKFVTRLATEEDKAKASASRMFIASASASGPSERSETKSHYDDVQIGWKEDWESNRETEATTEQRSIFVGNLHPDIEQWILEDAVKQKLGKKNIASVRIHSRPKRLDARIAKSAIIEFKTVDDAEDAMEALDRLECMGKQMRTGAVGRGRAGADDRSARGDTDQQQQSEERDDVSDRYRTSGAEDRSARRDRDHYQRSEERDDVSDGYGTSRAEDRSARRDRDQHQQYEERDDVSDVYGTSGRGTTGRINDRSPRRVSEPRRYGHRDDVSDVYGTSGRGTTGRINDRSPRRAGDHLRKYEHRDDASDGYGASSRRNRFDRIRQRIVRNAGDSSSTDDRRSSRTDRDYALPRATADDARDPRKRGNRDYYPE